MINPLKSESRSAGSWRGLLVNIRLLLLTAYDRTLLRFEETIRDQREKRNHPGWSFCTYFLLQVRKTVSMLFMQQIQIWIYFYFLFLTFT